MELIVTINQEKFNRAENAAHERTFGNVSVIDLVECALERIFGEGSVSILPIESRKH